MAQLDVVAGWLELLRERPLDRVERHRRAILSMPLAVDEGVPVGVGSGIGAVGAAGLAQDAADVAGGRVLADVQLCADLAVAEPARDEPQDLALSRRQLVRQRGGRGRSAERLDPAA